MKWKVNLTAAVLCACGIVASAQIQIDEDPVHTELRQLRTNVVESIVSGDFEKTLEYCHTNVVVTWQNNEVCRGHAGLQEFFQRVGKDAFKGYKVPPTPDAPTILHGGDTGIAYGMNISDYNLFGKHFVFTNRWTATLVRENDRWLLAAYHVSINVLDNPLLNGATRSLGWGVGLGALGGFLIGMLVFRRRGRAAR